MGRKRPPGDAEAAGMLIALTLMVVGPWYIATAALCAFAALSASVIKRSRPD